MARLVVVSAPSGAGKTTVIAEAIRQRPDWLLSISYTTRAARPGERDGVDYFFVRSEEFARLEAEDAFIETALVHGARYGTPRRPVEEALEQDRTMLLEIDVQGARSIRAAVPRALLVFIEPPSWEVLEHRLTARGTESPEAVATRLANAKAEWAAKGEFEHVVVNGELRDAVSQLIAIIERSSGPAAGTPSKESS